MELRINHTWPQLGFETTPPIQRIEQPRASLETTTTPMQVSVEGEAFHVEIDQSRCFAEAGLKNILEVIRDYAQEGRAALLEGIGRRAAEGTQMAAIDKGRRIEDIIAEKTLPRLAQSVLTFIPQSRPEISFVGGKTYKIEPGETNTKITANLPTHDYTPGSVRIYPTQYPELQIDWVPSKFDKLV